ncbi:ribonuclease P protein component, partial [Nocardia brasiliensis]|uniref:ribonuclease P protein component n=1 Tax=Nocardia brasiliensis TaxID=37326 RepID=UPI002456FF1C
HHFFSPLVLVSRWWSPVWVFSYPGGGGLVFFQLGVPRRLRHMCHQMISELPSDTDVVIRALPGAANASSAELLRQMRAALRKLGVGTV